MNMNPVPILLSVGSCGKLDQAGIIEPQHWSVSFPVLCCPVRPSDIQHCVAYDRQSRLTSVTSLDVT